MKSYSAYISLILAALALTLVFTGCGGTDTPADTSAAETTEAAVTEEEVALLELVSGKSSVKVIIPYNVTAAETDASVFIRDKIKSVTGVRPDLGDDFVPAWMTRDSEKIEILVGMTGYDETAQVLDTLTGLGDYAVAVKGSKVVIVSRSGDGMDAAAREFGKLISSLGSEGKLALPVNTSVLGTKKVDGDSLVLPADLPSFTVWEGDYDSMALICSGAASANVESYGKQLEAAGYTLYTENKVLGTDNEYRAYTNSDTLVTVLFTPNDSVMRIMTDPLKYTALPPKSAAAYTKVCDPFFMQLGICPDNDETANGMSFIYRLSDGSFMVWDGGFDDGSDDAAANKRQNAARLYEMMKKYAPDPNNIRISLWVITHPHIDHGGALQYFGSRFLNDKVKIERIVSWLPSAGQCVSYTDGMTHEKAVAYMNFYEKMRKNGTEVYRAHPGQVFYLADAVVEVIYTDDMMLPQSETASNPLSVICKVSLGGSTMLMTGDTTTDTGGKITNAMYGSAMACDFLQMPHHSYNIMSAAFYRSVSPKYVLVPIGKARYDYSRLSGVVGVMGADAKDRIYVANFTTQYFPLPFTGTGMVQTDNEFIANPGR